MNKHEYEFVVLSKIQTLMLCDHLPMFRKTTNISAVYENKFHADVTDSPGVFAAAIEVGLFTGDAVTDRHGVIAKCHCHHYHDISLITIIELSVHLE